MSNSDTKHIPLPSFTGEGLDRRTRRTREALLNALLALMKEKPLTAITVTELASLADVNRATFYTHYQDVFDLYDHLQEDLCTICRTMVEEHGHELAAGSYLGLIEEIYRFIDSNEQVFDVALSNETLLASMIPVVREAGMANAAIVETAYRKVSVGASPESREELMALCQTVCDYQFDYIAGGVVNILRSWMASGRKQSAHHMAVLTEACIHSLNPDGKCTITASTIKSLRR